MSSPQNPAPSYDTWIRKRRITFFRVLTLLLLASGFLGFLFRPLAFLSLVSIPFGYIAVVISLAAYRFSTRGDDLQNRIHQLQVDAVPGTGPVLDVGCGSGHLLIMIAKRMVGRRCVGIDTWESDWEYSLQQCRDNALAEGVSNTEFRRASAAELPFESGSFASVVSCLTFHEVTGANDRAALVAESLRVLEPGGSYAFIDLFHDHSHFPDPDVLTTAIVEAGCTVEQFDRLSDLLPLRFPMNTGRVLRHAVLATGHRI